jgi:hypothetical protein
VRFDRRRVLLAQAEHQLGLGRIQVARADTACPTGRRLRENEPTAARSQHEIAITSRERSNKGLRLRLRYQGQEVLVEDGRASITMGRAEENDLVIKGNLISRLHARLEFNRNKFMLIDQSTNGTFVIGKDGEEAFVRRDSMQIRGEGLIGLGKAPDSNSSQVIRYTCEE